MGNDDTKIHEGESVTEERSPTVYENDGIALGEYFAILRKNAWKIALFSLVVGLVTLLVMFQFPDIYQATAVLTPAVDEKRPNPALGILASFGIDIGSPTKVEDLETLFKSNDLTVRVFRKYNLWPVALPDRFDSATGKMKFCWTDRLFRGEKGLRAPGDWDAIRAAKDRLNVFVNKKTGTVSVSFETPSAEGSANIVKYYLDEGKSRLQEEALDRAVQNKKFIEEQIGKTIDALTRDRLYALYGQEVEREMMGRNREQFGFRVVDAPRVPDRKLKPHRFVGLIMSAFLSFFAGWIFYIFRGIASRKIALNPKQTEIS
jgi:uncharacterized protein involved in exopolysaccharide biosynthesis